MIAWIPLACLVVSTATALAGDPGDPNRVTGMLDGKTARLSARYELAVGANELAKGTRLEIPAGAVVIGARVTQSGVVHRLELTQAEAAGAKLDGLAGGVGGSGPKASAVLIDAASGGVTVSTASPLAGALVIELEVAMPTCFRGDVRYVMVPPSWYAAARRDLQRDSAGTCAATSDDGGQWLGFASPIAGDRISISADRVNLGDQAVVRFELDVASMLAKVPRDLATVLIVDGSRSLSDADRDAQRALVASYLAKAPSSRVQVVSFARTAQALLPAWTTAAQAVAPLDAALRSLVPRNGSNFDTGLAQAAAWLEQTVGARRVVLVTDERMASRLAHASLHDILPAGVLLHVVVVSSGGGLVRDDELKLAGLAARTEGFAVRLGSNDNDVDATMLVRPISLDRLKLVAHGWENLRSEQQCVDEMDVGEGVGCTWWGRGRDPGAITVEGSIWGKRVSRTLTPDLARSREVARELSVLDGAADELRSHAQLHAQAVNGTWSLYGAWGGTAGYDGVHGGGTWEAICGCGSYGTVGHGNGTGAGGSRTPSRTLQDQLEPMIAACGVETARVTVAVELTGIEIADVHVAGAAPALEHCIREAVWASSPVIDLPLAHQLVSFVVGR